jgi:hypothetical protein
MKMRYVFLSLTFALVCSFGYASNTVNTEDSPSGAVGMSDFMMDKAALKAEQKMDKRLLKAEKKAFKAEKRLAWAARVMNNKAAKTTNKSKLGGFSDPTDRWVWYAIIAGGAAILFWIIAAAIRGPFYSGFGFSGFLYALGGICFVAGVAAIVYWLILKNG